MSIESQQYAESFPVKKSYDNPEHEAFVVQITNAGFMPCHYEGRCDYEGPAVVVKAMDQELIEDSTSMRLARDSMALDYILYPDAAGYDFHATWAKMKKDAKIEH